MNKIWKWIKKFFKINKISCPNCEIPMKEYGTEHICPKCGYKIYSPRRYMGRF